MASPVIREHTELKCVIVRPSPHRTDHCGHAELLRPKQMKKPPGTKLTFGAYLRTEKPRNPSRRVFADWSTTLRIFSSSNILVSTAYRHCVEAFHVSSRDEDSVKWFAKDAPEMASSPKLVKTFLAPTENNLGILQIKAGYTPGSGEQNIILPN
jgi:hypothetical protein